MILKETFDGARRDIEGNGGSGVEVVSGTRVADGGSAVAGAPIGNVGFGLVVAGDPYWRAAGLPFVAVWPCFAAGLAWPRDRVSAPEFLAAFGIERRNE